MVSNPKELTNIGPAEQRKRLLTGIAMIVIGILILVVGDPDGWWRLFLIIPFWVGALGILQAKEKT